jgi:menaquinone reductase, molybdopterin-binding-like subunit
VGLYACYVAIFCGVEINMDRRNFFKIASAASASVATSSCGKKSEALIPLLVPEHEIVPGHEQWHPSICTECNAGCGVIVRIMEGERIVQRKIERFRERVACIKKIEGNPLDPVSGGRLCARGHAALQSLYNPDRIESAMRRTGPRGAGVFAPISWDEAAATVAKQLGKVRSTDPSKILFLTGSQLGTRSFNIQRFLESLGAPRARTCSLADLALERKAASLVFGWSGIPLYDLGQARHVLSVGADFLSGWASPVYYARQFGHFRQGRPGVRGTLVHAESRLSLTAASADEWLPLHPGSEPFFIIAILRLLLDEKLARSGGQLPAPVAESIESADLPALIHSSGIGESRLRRLARSLGESDAPLVIAGASVVHTNSVQALVAAHYLNLLLGNIGAPGGVLPPNPETSSAPESGNLTAALKHAEILFLDGENPVYTLPQAGGVSQALSRIETIVSFGAFVDDSSAYADIILPDHHPLESAAAVLPTVAPRPSITVATPFVQPLYDTRPIEQSLANLARNIGVAFEPVTPESFLKPMLPPDRTFDDVARRGGLWLDQKPETTHLSARSEKLEWSDASFAGAPDQFPLLFQPYLSLQYHDGHAANLPWMQELPDPVSSAMWGLPVEIDPQTAARLKIANGDWVRVESQAGSLEASAYVHPGAVPGVISMGIGEGHAHYGRYASGRGASPISILAAVHEDSTGALALGATRVRLARLERTKPGLIQFSPRDREQGPWGYR